MRDKVVCVTKSYLREMDSLAAWMSPSATPATQSGGRCHPVPHLPRKVMCLSKLCGDKLCVCASCVVTSCV